MKQQLERRSQIIQRAAALTKISFGEVNDHYFSVHVWWKGGELIKRFMWDDLYSDRCQLKLRPCQATRQFIQEILKQRGL